MNIQSDDPSPADLTSRDADDRPGIGAGTSQNPNTDGSGEAIRQNLQELRQFTDEQTEKAKTAVSDAAEDKKNLAARQLDGIASAFEKIGAELERSNQQAVGRYTKQIGGSLQNFAHDMEGRDLGEIAGMVEDFGRRQPLAFLGIAAIAGLTASRLLTASAHRRNSPTDSRTSTPSMPAGVEPLKNG
ncbi:nutrient deprivation-induced protein (plasmid) [Rhizobium sp. CB3171]|uniref:nutrient deprivation-induced protein n=1 Tax=Rhizobium sp. CB3171 TaxID=3039157 RepID=UPI0024B25E96|nr:nutrient deprivation-induced protein [Rhizobium sp. CB3171]WFU05709.1 nutrient deprivation-induced protein [Rhizobium sp. CB3171]